MVESKHTPIDDIRAVFAECEARQAKFEETRKQADFRHWKRHGGVLEVVCVGHMRTALDEIERLRRALDGDIFKAELPCVWTDFLDANPDDLTSPEYLPDHALMTGEQFEYWAMEAFERAKSTAALAGETSDA